MLHCFTYLLNLRCLITGDNNKITYRSAEGEQRRHHLRDVFLLPQVHRLKDVDVIHPVVLESLLEPTTCARCRRASHRYFGTYFIANLHYSQVDVLHHLELSAAGVDFRHRSGQDLVHEMAQYLAVFKHILEALARRELLADDRLDPFLRLLLLLRIALRRDLRRENAALENLRDSDVLERDPVESHVPGRKLEILMTLVDLETCK